MNIIPSLTPIPVYVLAVSLLVVTSPQPARAQSPAPAVAPLPDEETLHQELRGLKKIYEDAVNSGDLAPLAPAFGPQTSGVVALNQEFHSLPEMQHIFDDFKKSLGPDYAYHVTLNPERSLIYGDMAVCRGTSDELITSHGNAYKLLTRWSAVLRRENGQWHLLRSQVSMDPFHNSVLDAIIASVKWTALGWGAGVGALLGLITGFGLGRLRRKPA